MPADPKLNNEALFIVCARQEILGIGEDYVRSVDLRQPRIIRSLQRLLQHQQRLHDARLTGAVRARQDGERTDLDLLPFGDRFEAFDGNAGNPVAML